MEESETSDLADDLHRKDDEMSKTQDVYKPGIQEIKELLFGEDGKQCPKDMTTVKVLGHGAYGTVYLKTFKTSICEIEIAVKEIRVTNPTNKIKFEDTFRKEKSALEQFSHKRIVSYYGFMCTELTYHILIEYMPGGSLSEYIQQKTVIDEDEARHITQQVLEGIAYIHGKKLFHRDIKKTKGIYNRSVKQ
ncbi:Mitogen-activated protein kinase kinase kinase 2 [Bulinus truncatus]|nr:Mitogen-activated protein kinase kinase kinase 2 [Bulinus truncatus]